MKERKTVRLDSNIVKLINNMAATNDVTEATMIRHIIKAGIGLLNASEGKEILLSEIQLSKLNSLTAHCVYQNMLMLRKFLLKNDQQYIEEIDTDSLQNVRELIGIK